MKTEDFYYDLPERLIAQHPLKDRSSSRLLLVDKKNGSMEDKHFYDIIDYLNKGDVLVLNDTKVMPARIFGHRKGKEESIEVLLLKQNEDDIWECLTKPGKKTKIDSEIIFSDRLSGKVVDLSDDGSRFIKFNYEGIFHEILDELGEMPLPPYIKEKLEDKDRYQTVYSKEEGSAAAPTAGLHFTKELLNEIKAKGVELAYITLHIGLGTFRPVKVEDVENHKMHSEFYIINKEAADKINKAKKNGNRVIAVGTTSVRTIESVAEDDGSIKEKSGWTDIFIYPGFKFRTIDALITNFHLPESTLLMLVSAFSSKELMFKAYSEAIKKEYRFFSFGDAMFIY
ncbi:tRNA preQ1(34) S-adenosylmethionine ribosyltransferase-isomerase QueA [Peptoniphilus catoniae]|uniref:tRNA preQ1(34) S-adenosylmethionine ribosyltransferase-isomerase QueA n=1 Tax=Peptoniphilus catoniae TaxID=1660341 RepID=UPI0010FEC0EE|nr:tRNA preQ1(34) S-adenosylmethionine ribosyltransferase-isomerase QueA [Peptoniphilus catoniae]